MPIRIGVYGARPQRVLLEGHGIVIGVLIGRGRAGGAGMNPIANGLQIMAERRRKPQPLRRGKVYGTRGRLAEHLKHAAGCSLLLLLGRLLGLGG